MASVLGSSAIAATVCATLSPTVGTPRILVPPEALGISTARTGGGKYVPDDIRCRVGSWRGGVIRGQVPQPLFPGFPLRAASLR